MKEKICAQINENHEYICDSKGIARSGENICTQLEIELAECLCEYWVYIDFTKPDGTTYKTPRLDIVDNKITYDLPNALLSQKGTLKVQVVLQKEDGEIWKSTIKHYTISTSINATDDIPNQDDFITEAQKLLDELKNGGTVVSGGIKDVQVDGVSVVSDGIANINLSSLEKTLQDILNIIQGGELDELTVSKIEELIVSYFENKTIEEVEK